MPKSFPCHNPSVAPPKSRAAILGVYKVSDKQEWSPLLTACLASNYTVSELASKISSGVLCTEPGKYPYSAEPWGRDRERRCVGGGRVGQLQGGAAE